MLEESSVRDRLVIYNTLSQKKEEFVPISGRKVGMYACGITAYFSPHIGNMRTYVLEDVLRRMLAHEGYDVTHVENITDVGHLVSDADAGEDKIRLAAEKSHRSMREISDFYTSVFIGDMDRLNILKPDIMPRATDHIDDMVALIRSLDSKGYLYRAENGMYFDTSKFSGYGALTGMSFERLTRELKEGARVDKVAGKRNITDFVVWRFAHGDEKEMVWDTEWGRGFPGWHIECSAMSMRYLGEHFDIHCGGVDHIPVHHTNEIAQSEAATGKKFVNYWVHMQFLQVENTKMSKSLRNIYTVQDVVDKGFIPLALRLFYISGHYRQVLNFTFEALEGAQNTLKGVYSFMDRLIGVSGAGSSDGAAGYASELRDYSRRFFVHLRDDLNTPEALASMHHIIGLANRRIESGSMGREEADETAKVMLEFDKVLGLGLDTRLKSRAAAPDTEIQRLIGEREAARKGGDYAKADLIRRTLRDKHHIILEDTKDGVKWHIEP